MLTHNERIDQAKKRFQKNINIHRWEYDIASYVNAKKMIELAEKIGRDITWYQNYMQEIKNRWPNVKNWP